MDMYTKRALFLSENFGKGHLKAAQALGKNLVSSDASWEVKIINAGEAFLFNRKVLYLK